MKNFLTVYAGNMKVFGMDVPKVLVIGAIVAAGQFSVGDVAGAVNTVLIVLGIQKGGDAIGTIANALIKNSK